MGSSYIALFYLEHLQYKSTVTNVLKHIDNNNLIVLTALQDPT